MQISTISSAAAYNNDAAMKVVYEKVRLAWHATAPNSTTHHALCNHTCHAWQGYVRGLGGLNSLYEYESGWSASSTASARHITYNGPWQHDAASIGSMPLPFVHQIAAMFRRWLAMPFIHAMLLPRFQHS